MAEGASGLARAGIAIVALVAGAAAGVFTGRWSARTPPPPPAVFVNPMADVRKEESLTLKRDDGAIESFRVLDVDLQTALLLVETQPAGQPAFTRQLRVSRTWFGGFLILEGDTDPDIAAASLRDLRLDRVEPDTLFVEALGRPLRCWKFTGQHRVHSKLTFWVSDELPVHGVVRIDSEKVERMYLLHGSHDGR